MNFNGAPIGQRPLTAMAAPLALITQVDPLVGILNVNSKGPNNALMHMLFLTVERCLMLQINLVDFT